MVVNTVYGTYSPMRQVSTGQRINRAGDDSAGLAISEKMRSQVNGEKMASRNMRDSQSLYNTAEGALNTTQSALQRMRELAVQANSSILTDSDRTTLQQEFSQLRDSVDAIGKNTAFNTKNLLDGSLRNMSTTVNANGESVSFDIDASTSDQLGLDAVDLINDPSTALGVIDDALRMISDSRTSIGTFTNRLDSAISVSTLSQLNTAKAESGIRDADIALAAINMNRTNLLQQTYFATLNMEKTMHGQILNLLR